MEWRTVVVIVLVVSLCFFIVPIRVGPDKAVEEDAELFAKYVARYNKSYKDEPAEYNKRFEHFQKSLRHIKKLNGLRSSQESAYYGLTEFSDLSKDEFLQQTLLPDLPLRGQKHMIASYYHQHLTSSVNRVKRLTGIPSKFDWRDQKVVGPVASQESCGACWAFSTVGVAESMYAIKNGTLYSFSVQEVGRYIPDTLFYLQREGAARGRDPASQNANFTEVLSRKHRRINWPYTLMDIKSSWMIDCMPGGNGCQGGDICSLLSWLSTSKTRITSETDYPLTLRADTCRLPKIAAKTSGVIVTDFTCDSLKAGHRTVSIAPVFANNRVCFSFVDAETELLTQLVTHGPMAAAVNAISWQHYLGGVIQCQCDGSFNSLNHAVQIVGYDTAASIPHYIIKNSWGPSFGDKGYIYIAVGKNLCGIANQVSSLEVG
ncbi:Cathepsin O [Temnothorax longispinosus]|uniref:Cathepsin O n=1 Tax=Temnothorax longispinosus TaxID=300112 RepID=A0A4S2KC43_9HYME|nr:Cathepsin O [Temnothorax longispinosus]